MFVRNIKKNLIKALDRSPVVLLNGARQVGKSTLARQFIKERGYTYITFDDESVFLAAQSDPAGFLENLSVPVIIDEVQRVPEIFLAIKIKVDTDRVPGSYLLTGSANPLLIPKLADSLAGRMEVIDLMPLSQGELQGTFDHCIDELFLSEKHASPKYAMGRQELYLKIFVGGYPLVQGVDDEARVAWMQSYINLILQRDIKDLAQIEKIAELPKLLKVLALRASNLLNVSEVSRDCGMVAQTVRRYIALLETIFLISLQMPWHANESLRYIKSPKVYLVDSGLLAYLLGITVDYAATQPLYMGKILENFVLQEFKKQATWSKVQPEIYHFRTADGKEVDIIFENRRREIVGVEVKHADRVTPHDFKVLAYLREKFPDRFIKGVVLYTGSQAIPFGDRLWALPVQRLWEA